MSMITNRSANAILSVRVGPELMLLRSVVATLVFLFSWLLCSPLQAQRNTFDPSLGLGYIYRSNVLFSPIEEETDSSLRLTIRLPVDRQLKKGSLRFSYTGYVENFDKNQDLDNIGHRLNFGVSTKPTRRSSISFDLGYSRSQDEGGPSLGIVDETEDPTFYRRAERDRLALRFSYDQQLSQKWYAGLSIGAAGWAFEDPTDNSTPEVSRDRFEAVISGQIGRVVSPSLRVGLVASFTQFDLDFGGITDSVAAAVQVQKDLGEDLNWSLRLGGFRNETDDAVEGVQTSTQTGWLASFNLNKNLRNVALNFLARHGPASGGFRIGTSVNSTIYLSMIDNHFRKWGWGVFLRAGQRDPDIDLEPTLIAYEAGTGIQTSLVRVLAMSFGASWVTQDDDFVDSSYSFYRLSATLSWHPLGWKKFSSWTTF